MNEKKENSNNSINIEETKNQKCINPNLINKKLFNKNSIRKQKRLFQMQKRLALLNEEELSEIELDINNEKNEIVNNLNSFQQFKQNKKQINKIKQNKNSLSFNCTSNHKESLSKDNILKKEKDITFINLENIIEENNELKNEENKKLKNEVESRNNKDDNKEEELSIKKKNTNSNTNDEDKSSSEVILYNEFDQNRKKSINQNDSIEQIAFTKIINEDIDENTDIVSKNNENINNNKINEENKDVFNENLNSKDFVTENFNNNENKQENFMNNFDFFNIINDTNDNDEINKNENENSVEIKDIENENKEEQNNSAIINEDYNENKNTNENVDNNNEDEENVELNISNLEIDINQINNDTNFVQNEDELVMSGSNSNEFAKKYLSSKSKSFIKFNNNLTARVAAHSLKNSPSYMLALCPELLDGFNKKNIIKDNYAVTDAISEEMESDTFTPRQSEKIDYSINKNTIDYNQSINTNNEYQLNNTLRNKEIKNPINIGFLLENKEQISPKCFNKNKNKINKNRIKEIKDINIELKDFTNSKNKKINKKSYSTSINPLNHIFNTKNNNSNKKNGILKNSEKKNIPINDNLKIKIKHQKAKSLVNNSQINSIILNGNINHNNNSPKQVSFKLFDSTNSSTKGILKNSNYKKLLFNKEKSEKSKDLKNKQKKYLSNDIYSINNSQNNYKNYKKTNSNGMMINNLKLCKSDKRTKKIATKMHNSYSQKNNAQFLSKSNPYKDNKINNNEKKKNVCYTEKANKSKNYITFISHMKKNTPVNINNMTEQNINHSKKLSQQICDGYNYFMNSLNSHNNNYNNRLKEINRINLGLNNFNNIKSTPLSNYFSFNKNKLINTNNNNNCNNNNLTFIKKNSLHKDDKKPFIISIHNKSKTSFISPSYQNLSKNKLLNKNLALINNKSANKKKNNEKLNNNIKKLITKNNNKFNEIKKIVNDSTVKIIHKKINTIGNSNDLTKLLNTNINNGFNKQLKGSSSNNNLRKNFNKHKIIMALQHIKFVPNENYSKALNELYKSKKNLFIILVYTDSTQRYIFRGLYEVNSTDQKTANKLFAPGFTQNTVNIISLNSFFNYQSNNGEFVKIKFKNENDKKFNSDTIIVY